MNIPYKKLTQEQKDLIVTDYTEGKEVVEIQSNHKISNYTLGRIRKEYSISSRRITYSEEVINNAIIDFQNGFNYKKITEKYGISDTTFYRYLKKRGLNVYTNKGRKNNFNQQYFEKIDTIDKAYFLGFIYGDGSINKSNKEDKSPVRLRINISNKDVEILENFCFFIEYNPEKITHRKPVGSYSTNKMSSLSIKSKKLCDDLIEKDFRLLVEDSNGLIFDYIPENLWSHFIRGLNDADGSTSERLFSFTNQIALIEKIQEIFKIKLGIEHSKTYKYKDRGHKTTRDLRYKRIDSLDIFKYLYEDSTPKTRLNRKYQTLIDYNVL